MAAGLGIARPATAAPRICVAPDDRKVEIRGFIGQSESFVRSVRVIAAGGDVPALVFLASDLRRDGGNERIDRSRVTLASKPILKKGVARDLVVRVAGIQRVGVYRGWIVVRAGLKPAACGPRLAVVVTAAAHPTLDLIPGMDRVSFHAVRCRRWCWLSKRVLNMAEPQPRTAFAFSVKPSTDIDVLRANVSVSGEKSHEVVQDSILFPFDPQHFDEGSNVRFDVQPHLNDVVPDHYTGAISLRVADSDASFVVPVDFTVRDEAFWPIVAILSGLILGTLYKYMKDRGDAQLTAYAAIRDATGVYQQLRRTDKDGVAPLIAKANAAARSAPPAEAVAAAKVAQHASEQLLTLERIEERAAGTERGSAVSAQAAELRPRILDGEDVAGELGNLRSATTTPVPPVRYVDVTWLRERLGESEDVARGVARRFWRWLWTDWHYKSLRLLRWALAGATALLLAAVGLHELYVEQGTSFGVGGFFDYAGLLFWGVAAAAAGRTVADVAGPAPGARVGQT
jgi:hypothetical protein